jgi:hypothetical protein
LKEPTGRDPERDALISNGFSGRMAFPANSRRDAEILEESGADLRVNPFAHSAREAAEILIEGTFIEESCRDNRGAESPAGENDPSSRPERGEKT